MSDPTLKLDIIFTGSTRLQSRFADGKVTDIILRNPGICSMFVYGVRYSKSGRVKIYSNKFHDLGILDIALEKFGYIEQMGTRYVVMQKLEDALTLRRDGTGLGNSLQQAGIHPCSFRLLQLYLVYSVSRVMKLVYRLQKRMVGSSHG